MAGAPAMREVTIWVQTDKACNIQIEYWIHDKEKKITQAVRTSKESAYTAKITLDDLEPGQKYFYQILINGKKQKIDSLTFKTAPLWGYGRGSIPEFSVALGSCHFTNDQKYDRKGIPFGQDTSIFEAISNKKPDLMLWLGDNVYLRDCDFDSKYGIFYRYSHTRQKKYMVNFLRKTHHLAIWDDHDYGPNDSDRSFYFKKISRDAFIAFWPNPGFGFPDFPNQGITTFYRYGDVDFFLLDNRWWRSPKNLKGFEAEMLGNKQIQWLIESLKSSYATFKIICVGSQMLNPNTGYENFENYETEKKLLFNLIDQNNIKGILFVSGDRHFSEVSKVIRTEKYPLYEITSSPLTSSPFKLEDNNPYRIPGSFINEQNFAILHFKGSEKNRYVEICYYNKKGDLLFTYTIFANELK
jgi:alkaline phosphatase D